jgi:hypothetical protein
MLYGKIVSKSHFGLNVEIHCLNCQIDETSISNSYPMQGKYF